MKPPRIFKDLYSDLRDRRLLPVVFLLVLATLAVPFLLRSDPEPISSSTPALPVETEAAPTLPAVLTANPTLRDYRDRLDSLSSKNPFAGDAPESGGPAPESADAAPIEGGAETASAGGSSSFSESFDQTVTSSGGSTSTAPAEEDVTVDVDDSANSADAGAEGGSGSAGESRWFTFSVDVLTGPAGDTRRRNDLQNLTVLPSKSNPVAVYIGVTEGGKGANFMLSPDVVGASGGGSCMPAPSRCQFLTLKQGQEQKLDYAPNGEADTYVLDVKDIRFEEVKDPREAGNGDSAGTREGLSAFAAD